MIDFNTLLNNNDHAYTDFRMIMEFILNHSNIKEGNIQYGIKKQYLVHNLEIWTLERKFNKIKNFQDFISELKAENSDLNNIYEEAQNASTSSFSYSDFTKGDQFLKENKETYSQEYLNKNYSDLARALLETVTQKLFDYNNK